MEAEQDKEQQLEEANEPEQLRVLSYQESGVAWVPWRIQQLMNATDVNMVLYGRNSRRQVRYGLPNTLAEAQSACDAIKRYRKAYGLLPDVLHLHHGWIAQRQLPDVRSDFPNVRVLVTAHGEPDRSRWKVGAAYPETPDGYHVVSSDLLPFVVGKAPLVRYVPNHPGRELPEEAVNASAADLRLFVPFSNVPQYKNWGERDQLAALIMEAKGHVLFDSQVQSNDAILESLQQHAFCWVQLQGYAPDILSMECWASGCIPIVLKPGADQLKTQREFFNGVLPPYVFEEASPEKLLATIRDLVDHTSSGVGAINDGKRFMSASWSHQAATDAYRQLYHNVAAV